MQLQSVGLELTDAERPLGGRLLKLVAEIDRVEGYSEPHAVPLTRLAVELGARAGLHGSDLTSLKYAALAHDVGERALKREYLLSSRKLTSEERLDLVRHSILGEQAAAQFRLPRASQLYIRWHHEWWNGYGYPDGLAGEQIPLGARVLRVADTYCALISDRPHRLRHDPESAEAIMADLAGLECDPGVVKLLLELLKEERSREDESRRTELINFPAPSDWLPAHEIWDNQNVWVDEVSVDEKKDTPVAARPSLVARASRRWLGFELSVLRRLKFSSIAIPFAGRPDLGWHLKCWGKQVITNDICQWSWWMSRALIENSRESLDVEDVAFILGENAPAEDVGVTGSFPLNADDEGTWFLKVRDNIHQLGSEQKRALAYLHALDVADYLRSFTRETEHLRRPLNEVFTALWRNQRPVIDNQQLNLAANQDAHDFIRGVRADCMFVRLPQPEGLVAHDPVTRWRESWVRENESDWETVVAERAGKLGDSVVSKDHYLELVASFFERARHIPKWAIAHADDGFLSAAEVGELMRQFRRRVEVTYAKDFSGVVGGTHSYILIAG
jgi:hypothetical protein